MSLVKEYTFDRVVRIVITVAVVAGLVWIIHALKNVLLPFFVACLIAYLCEPAVQSNRRMLHLRGRVLATFVTLFETAFIICALLYFVGPMVSRELHNMAEILRNYATSELHGNIVPQPVHEFLRHSLDFDSLSRTLSQQEWMSMIENLLRTSWDLISGGFSILLGIFNWCIVLLYVIFIMIDYERLSNGFKAMVPPTYRHIVFGIGHDVKKSMNHYFRGQALIALIVGVLFAVGFSIIGMPLAIVFGLFIGVLNLVPYLQLVSLVPAVALCIIASAGGDVGFWTIFIQCITVYCVVQAIQDLYLTPRIMGKAMGLNPAIILLSLSIWGTLLGFIGLIIALPLTTLLLSYYEHYISGGHAPWDKKKAKALEAMTEQPFDPDEENGDDKPII